MNGTFQPPLPPPPPISMMLKWRVLVFMCLHHCFGGGVKLLFFFILPKIVDSLIFPALWTPNPVVFPLSCILMCSRVFPVPVSMCIPHVPICIRTSMKITLVRVSWLKSIIIIIILIIINIVACAFPSAQMFICVPCICAYPCIHVHSDTCICMQMHPMYVDVPSFLFTYNNLFVTAFINAFCSTFLKTSLNAFSKAPFIWRKVVPSRGSPSQPSQL